jgi:hypothetical protein
LLNGGDFVGDLIEDASAGLLLGLLVAGGSAFVFNVLGIEGGGQLLLGIYLATVAGTIIKGYTDRQSERAMLAAAPQGLVSAEDYPDDWDELRREVYQRDNYTCGNCSASDIELHAHHIVPLSRGGTNALSNLTTLCVDCHELLHPHMRN